MAPVYAITLYDTTETTNISGQLPEEVHISTLTQAFCTGYSFCLHNGRIWVKTDDSTQWELFLSTGLPFYKGSKHFAKDKWFDPPQAICEIACDDDTLMAFDTNGAMYRCYIKDTTPEKPFVWTNGFGWPAKDTFYQLPSVANKRAWAMGVRRQSVLYHEDIFGNQHHYGTMGLETLYFLCENGQEIRFTDSGLPTDLSRSILGPERGSFIARNMSVSADTIFLINDAGEMYTRLIDFDTMGADPMWFKYTYKAYKQNLSGKDYLSNYTEWGLPNEDWHRQPSIPLEGKARLSRFICIFQNGQGNYARELRVAGTDSEGTIGYYHKSLRGQTWSFTPARLSIQEQDFIPGKDAQPKLLHGKPHEYSYTGHVLKNGQPVAGITCSIPDFTLTTEGSCTLHFDTSDAHTEIPLYLLEVWTYITRNKPGLDGTPNNFFATPVFEEKQLDTTNKELSHILHTLFGNKNKEIYSLVAEATDQYVEITSTKENDIYTLFLTKYNTALTPQFFKITSIYTQPLIQYYSDDSLVLSPERTYTIDDTSEIHQKIQANIKYIESLHNEMEVYKKYYHGAFLFHWGFKTVDVLTTITLINKIVDFPKIKTLTHFGGTIIQKNAEKYKYLLAFQAMSYPYIVELVQKRLDFYQELLETIVRTQEPSKLNAALQADYTAYMKAAGIRTTYKGYSANTKSKATLSQVTVFPLTPLWELSIDNDTSGTIIRIELPNILTDLIEKQTESFTSDIVFITFAGTPKKEKQSPSVKKLTSKPGIFEKDGNTIRIWVMEGARKGAHKKLVFESAPI